MVFIDNNRADYSLCYIFVMELQVEKQLLHSATRARAGTEEQNLLGILQRLGYGLVKTLLFRLSLAICIILVVVQGAAQAQWIIRHDPLRDRSMQFRSIYPRFSMIDNHQ